MMQLLRDREVPERAPRGSAGAEVASDASLDRRRSGARLLCPLAIARLRTAARTSPERTAAGRRERQARPQSLEGLRGVPTGAHRGRRRTAESESAAFGQTFSLNPEPEGARNPARPRRAVRLPLLLPSGCSTLDGGTAVECAWSKGIMPGSGSCQVAQSVTDACQASFRIGIARGLDF